MAKQEQQPPVHPGLEIRRSIIPVGLSVTEAAKRLGVGRPALSNLLNGKAALSPEMAMRIEKTFGFSATRLLAKQSGYDEHDARAQENEIAVRTYATPYFQITAKEIASWSDGHDARYQLPALLRKLVHSTGTNSKLTEVDFPAFDNSQQKGWDGWITSEEANPWIPFGKSGWEFSCNKNTKSKAESDYMRRTNHTTSEERKNTTFVFATPRNWQGKKQWARDKKDQRLWKDVRVFDASDLEQWLEQSISAQIRFREFLGCISEEVASLDQVWEKWAGATQPEINQEIFSSAVKRHQSSLKEWLLSAPKKPFVVTADSSLEALAFLKCALRSLDECCSGIYDRAVVVHSCQVLGYIAKSSVNFLAIVESTEIEHNLAGFYKTVPTIIVRGRNTLAGSVNITLDLLDHKDFQDALENMGIDNRQIDRLARESGRSPTILRRRLAEIPAIKLPPWAENDTVVQELIPFIFVGAWTFENSSDQEILCYLANSHYDEIEQAFARLHKMHESPVWSIGSCCGVVSKIDALYAAHNLITQGSLKKFLIVANYVLSDNDPAAECSEGKQAMAVIGEKKRDCSSVLRQGICDTLVLMAVQGNDLFCERLEIDIEVEVSEVIRRLFAHATDLTWFSQRKDLPYYAEAAPSTFLEIVEFDLNSDCPKLAVLFAPSGPGIWGGCTRAELLWALELLAWNSQHLMRVVSILAKLCRWKIKDNWAHTPLATLAAIFRFWMPQTSAALNERNLALEKLVEKFPQIGWQICLDQFHSRSALGWYNYRPRWRVDGQKAGQFVMGAESRSAQNKAVALALHWPCHDAHTLCDLIERLDSLDWKNCNLVWDCVVAWHDTGPSDEHKAMLREKIRRCTLTRRSPIRNLNDTLRDRARDIYTLLEPSDTIARHSWLFLQAWIELSADEIESQESGYKKHMEQIALQRRDALIEVWQQLGVRGFFDLCALGDTSHDIGRHLAQIHTEIMPPANLVVKLLSDKFVNAQDKIDQCITGFLITLDSQQRSDVLSQLLDRLAGQDDLCIRVLRCAPMNSSTWRYVDRLPDNLNQRYWKEIEPNWSGHQDAFDIARLVDKFLDVGKSREAFVVAQMRWESLNSRRLLRLLNEFSNVNSEPFDYHSANSYYISEALDLLENRTDVSRNDLAQLEFKFINALRRSEHGIRNLELQIAESPELFVQILAMVFKRSDGGEDPPGWGFINSDNHVADRSAAYWLLEDACRIPGTQADGSINPQTLKQWLTQTRALANQYGRAKIGDERIGQLLSRCSRGKDGIWPCEPIRDFIEDAGSTEIMIGMNIGIRNSRGAMWRGEGGAQERELVDQYRRWSKEVAFEYPYTSKLLDDIACDYEREATWWDKQTNVRRRLDNYLC